jgi:ribosomal-protein-alanine N-acetyltransferase
MELATTRLHLRELTEDDAPACNAYERDPAVARYLTTDVRTLEESLGYIRGSRLTMTALVRRTFDLAITLRADGQLIGRIGLCVTHAEIGEGTLWFVLHPAHWGQGYAAEAARALGDFGFDALRLHRLFTDCDPRNHASIRVSQKLGMRREAHLVENAFIKGEWVDTLIHAILAREWRDGRGIT